jgi:polygalacturonase
MSLNRRVFLGTAGWVSAAALLGSCQTSIDRGDASADWSVPDKIIQSIQRVNIPNKRFEIAASNLPKPGSGDVRPALQSVVDEAHQAGGGKVVVPAGLWLSDGPIRLRSNVELHLAKGSHIRFSPTPESYLPAVLTRWEGTDVYTYSPMLYAEDCENIALTGPGKLDGQGKDHWLPWRQAQEPIKSILRDMGRDGVPVEERVFIGDRRLRPYFVQFNRCKRVLVDGPTLIDSPFWMVHPLYCEDVIVRNLKCYSPHINSDGVDPDSSKRVLIETCTFDVGDDGVSIKAGRDEDGRRVARPSEDIVIRNCAYTGRTGGAVAIGSEMSGGVRNVWVDGFTMQEAKHALYFKSNLDRGGMIRDVFIRRIFADKVHSVLVFSNNYHSYRGGNAPTDFRDVYVENVRVNEAVIGISIQGNSSVPVRNVWIKDMTVAKAEYPLKLSRAEQINLDRVRMNDRFLSTSDALDVDAELVGN